MAITTYAELKTAIANWLARSDLTSEIDDFIDLAEAEYNRDLRIRGMETSTSFTIDSEQEDLPTGFLGVRSFVITSTTNKTILQYMSPFHQFHTQGGSTTGTPRAYSIEGSKFRFSPSPDASYTATLVYYKAITSLSSSNTTNDILTYHPELYLYGSLYHATNFIRGIDPDTVAHWEKLYKVAIETLKEQDQKEKYNGSPLIQRSGININNYDNVSS